jgi:hypothetical protein
VLDSERWAAFANIGCCSAAALIRPPYRYAPRVVDSPACGGRAAKAEPAADAGPAAPRNGAALTSMIFGIRATR